ncbi:MAG: Hsp33 family molecular chaperone HslO [Spirochaetota bacterium]
MPLSDRAYSMSFHTRDADFRAVFVSAAEAINAATAQVHVDEKAFYHFSELVVCANLLAGQFRDVQDITLDLTTPKYLRNLVVEATPEGIFRATCQTSEDLASVVDPAQIDEDVGSGLLHVSKRYARIPEPTRSTVGSRSKAIPNLVQQYLHESEQIATLMLTGMKLRQGSGGNIEADKCFGLLIEALPDVSEAKKFILTDNLERLESLTKYFGGPAADATESKDVMDLLDDIYPGEQWIETSEVALVYRCRCHRQGYLDRLAHMARRDIGEIFGEQKEIEVRCGYCKNVFNYTRAEIEEHMKKL